MRHKAIYSTHPQVVTIDDTAGASDKDGNLVVIDEAKVSAEIAKMESVWDAQEYARNRKAEYPTIEECVHAMLDGDLDELQAKRQVVKQKYPKE